MAGDNSPAPRLSVAGLPPKVLMMSLPSGPANLTAQADARRNYLTNQAARTHLFRIRVPIRNVDPTAYQ